MFDTLDTAVRSFRLGMDAAGNAALAQVLGEIEQAVVQVADAKRVQAIMPILRDCLRAQQHADYAWLADLLQYELRPRLYTLLLH